MDFDIAQLTLGGLTAIGVVNVVTFFRPDLDSKVKFALSAVAAFAVAFVPVEIGNVVLEKAKEAVIVAFAASGIFKLAQKAGGDSGA